MRLAMFLAAGFACAVASIVAVASAWAQAGPLPYAPGPGPRVFGGPFGRGPLFVPPRGPFAMPLRRGPFFGPPGVFVGPPRDAVVGPPPAPLGPRFDPPAGRVCFNAVDARDKIIANRLTEPFQALRLGRFHGEALRARLCRWPSEQFIYEIAVLRRDGRIGHVYMNAQNGKTVGGSMEPED